MRPDNNMPDQYGIRNRNVVTCFRLIFRTEAGDIFDVTLPFDADYLFPMMGQVVTSDKETWTLIYIEEVKCTQEIMNAKH
jgi:hypothetical protein